MQAGTSSTAAALVPAAGECFTALQHKHTLSSSLACLIPETATVWPQRPSPEPRFTSHRAVWADPQAVESGRGQRPACLFPPPRNFCPQLRLSISLGISAPTPGTQVLPCPCSEAPRVRLPTEISHTRHKPTFDVLSPWPWPQRNPNHLAKGTCSLSLGTASFFSLAALAITQPGISTGRWDVSSCSSAPTGAVLVERDNAGGLRAGRRSLGGLKQLIKKKKSHPSSSAGNHHPHEDKRVGTSCPPLPCAPPPTLQAPHMRGFC